MSLGANRVVDRRNRVVWTVTWAVVVVLGVATLLAGFGAFGSEVAERPLVTDEVAQQATDQRTWWWLLAFLVAVVAVVAGLAWLWLEVRPVPHGGEVVVRAGHGDRVRVPTAPLLDAVLADASEADDVRSARGRLDLGPPVVAVLRLDVDPEVDLGALAEHLDRQVADRLERTVGEPVRLDVEVDRRATSPRPRVA